MRGCRRNESARAQEGPLEKTRYQSRQSGAGMIQAGFTEALPGSPLSTQDAGAEMKTPQPGSQRGSPSEGGGPVDWSADRNPPVPPGVSGHAGEAPASKRRRRLLGPAYSGFPARGPSGSSPPPGDLGASAERKRERRQPGASGDAARQRPAALQGSRSARVCVGSACGARPGR